MRSAIGPAASRILTSPWLCALVFLVLSLHFLYFFVDDEMITFVYAQNLLRGRGLSYSSFEGAVEGYSNFLHVLVVSVFLGAVNLIGAPKLAAVGIAKVYSLLCGAALAGVTAYTLRRMLPGAPWHAAAATAFVVFSGPVGVWSASALETVPFALAFTIFLVSLLPEIGWGWRVTAAAATAAALLRIDGALFVAAGFAGFLFFTTPERRRSLRRPATIVVAVLLTYGCWRWWYFGTLLPLPLETKVMYKLQPQANLVSFDPPVSYLQRFFALYHPAGLVLALGGGLLLCGPRRSATRWRVAAIVVALAAYVSIVGDWMFAHRFYVALFPAGAVLIGYTLAELRSRSRLLSAGAAAIVTIWACSAWYDLYRQFPRSERLVRRTSWLREPSLDPLRFFSPYYELYRDVRGRLRPGDVTVNNQAGFLTFMLDLENIDDLGITSRFFATLPTRDVVFTEVGRYHALTRKPPFRAGEAYVLYRQPDYLVSWKYLIVNANWGELPQEIWDGHFRLAWQSDYQVVYVPTERARDEFRKHPSLFSENHAHPANLELAAVNGARLPVETLEQAFPFLHAGRTALDIGTGTTVELGLKGHPVSRVWIDRIAATAPATMQLELRGERGELVYRTQRPIPVSGNSLHHELPQPTPVSRVMLRLEPGSGAGARVSISDMRVLGQSPALEAHVLEELEFVDEVKPRGAQ